MGRVGLKRDLPALPGPRPQAQGLQHQRKKPGRDLLAGRHHGIVFATVIMSRGLAAILLPLLEAPGLFDKGHKLVGGAGHGRDDHGASMTCVGLPLHMRGNVADPTDVGDGGPAEFQHQQGHGLIPGGS